MSERQQRLQEEADRQAMIKRGEVGPKKLSLHLLNGTKQSSYRVPTAPLVHLHFFYY